MASLNRVTLIGHVGSDPELKHTNDNKAVCNFSVATNEKWKDKSGSKQEHTEWHRVTCWNQLAENVVKYLVKGGQVFVEGKIKTRQYEKDGQKRYSTEVVADKVLFLGGNNGNGSRQSNKSSPGGGAFEDTGEQQTGTDDIPF